MRFLLDAQLPPALARRLEALDHRAEHVADCTLLTAPDAEIWQYAVRSDSVIVTKDADFATRRLLHRPSYRVASTRHSRRGALLARVESDLPAIVLALEEGETHIEVVRSACGDTTESPFSAAAPDRIADSLQSVRV